MAEKKTATNTGTDDNKECFVIMPISDVDGYPAGHFNEVYTELIKPAVVSPHRI